MDQNGSTGMTSCMGAMARHDVDKTALRLMTASGDEKPKEQGQIKGLCLDNTDATEEAGRIRR